MSETGPWAAPGGMGPGGTESAGSGSGGTGPDWSRPAGTGYDGPPPPWPSQAPPGWAPPPKPGLIPLRPLGLGDILGAAFRVFRRNPRTLFGTALVVQLGVFVVTAAIAFLPGMAAVSGLSNATETTDPAVFASAFGAVALASAVPQLLGILVDSVLQGLFVIETSHQVVGEKLRVRGLLRQARGRIAVLVGWSLLLMAAAAVTIGILASVIGVLVAVGGRAGIVVAVILGIVGGLACAAAAIWITIKTALVPSVLVLERMTLGRAIARSWRLTQHNFWRTFGILALVSIIIGVASGVITTPVQFASQIATGTLQPNGASPGSAIRSYLITTLVVQFVSTLVAAVAAVIRSASHALVYVDLRIRREGLDLDLVRYVELRSAGVAPLPDPYRTPDRSAASSFDPPAGAPWSPGSPPS